jgi:hypothetical protein
MQIRAATELTVPHRRLTGYLKPVDLFGFRWERQAVFIARNQLIGRPSAIMKAVDTSIRAMVTTVNVWLDKVIGYETRNYDYGCFSSGNFMTPQGVI